MSETSVGVLADHVIVKLCQIGESWCDFDEGVIFLSVTILLDVLKVKLYEFFLPQFLQVL